MNIKKCSLFGLNVDNSEVEGCSRLFNCKVGKLPFVHLGILVGANMNRVVNWQVVIEVFKRRLSLWKASQLSIGGRLVLVKAVLDSIPIYYLSLFRAPQKVLDKLDSMRMNFLWGGSENKFKIHWIKNEDVKKEKKHGGLGLARLEDVNKSLISKWIWRYKTEPQAL